MNQTFAILFILEAMLLLVTELWGVWRRNKHKEDGDTITEGWRWIDSKLGHTKILQWFWRVFTSGLLVWTLLHLKTVVW